jgi:hypothetical protein
MTHPNSGIEEFPVRALYSLHAAIISYPYEPSQKALSLFSGLLA